MQKLSAYTHARYCTDESDILSGVREIKEAMEYRRRMEKTIPNYFYIRKRKLDDKLKMFITKGLRADEFRYIGHIFQAERQFKPHEGFAYVGRRLTRLDFDGWNWNEFYVCTHAIGHENIALHDADVFIMDRDFLVVPCENFLGKYSINDAD